MVCLDPEMIQPSFKNRQKRYKCWLLQGSDRTGLVKCQQATTLEKGNRNLISPGVKLSLNGRFRGYVSGTCWHGRHGDKLYLASYKVGFYNDNADEQSDKSRC